MFKPSNSIFSLNRFSNFVKLFKSKNHIASSLQVLSFQNHNPFNQMTIERRLSTLKNQIQSPLQTSQTSISKLQQVSISHTRNMSTSAPEILAKLHSSGCAHLTLNRPKVYNALTVEMCESILIQLRKWSKDPNVKYILMDSSASPKAFCAGGDIKRMQQSARTASEFFRKEYTMNYLLSQYHQLFKKPIIALMDGITMGGGVGLSTHVSHRISTNSTVWAMPETAIALFPDVGTTYVLTHQMDPAIGLYLALTGHRLGGEDCKTFKLAEYFVENSGKVKMLQEKFMNGASDVDVILREYASEVTNSPTLIHLPLIKRFFGNTSHLDDVFKRLRAVIDDPLSEKESKEWCQMTLSALNTKSPSSMLVTYYVLDAARHRKSLKECLEVEFRVATRIMSMSERGEGDFREGVRAVVIDKDNKPKWFPRINDEKAKHIVFDRFTPDENIEELNLEFD